MSFKIFRETANKIDARHKKYFIYSSHYSMILEMVITSHHHSQNIVVSFSHLLGPPKYLSCFTSNWSICWQKFTLKSNYAIKTWNNIEVYQSHLLIYGYKYRQYRIRILHKSVGKLLLIWSTNLDPGVFAFKASSHKNKKWMSGCCMHFV